jgi:hypothetical protein
VESIVAAAGARQPRIAFGLRLIQRNAQEFRHAGG